MDNPDEYVLQVFRRVQAMLESELVACHAAKLLKLGEKVAQSSDLLTEAGSIKGVDGFSKAGIAFEWLIGRAKRDAEFTLEQFDADVHLLHEALLAGFLNEPEEPMEPAQEPDVTARTPSVLPEPDWNSGTVHAIDSPEAAEDAHEEVSPSFIDLLDHPMLLTVRRLADAASAFDRKPAPERATSLAVLKMMAKSIVDMARPQNKVVVTGTFQEIASMVEAIERKGHAREDATEETITELGRILSAALCDLASGMRYMNEIREFTNEHKENGSK